MAKQQDASKSRLLDALDGDSIFASPRTPQTTPANAEAGSSTAKNRQMLMTARRAQVEDLQGSQPATDVSTFLARASSSRSTPKAAGTGFRLNYDAETPIRSIDIGGPDQAQRMAEFVTRTIDNQSHGVTVNAARAKLGLKDANDTLPGLEVRLLPHQCIGVSWMIDQEKSNHKGGIMADDMGLGKTVQMIATMIMNMPGVDDECRTTLIVVPGALLQQWKDEIDSKTNGVLTSTIHHGKGKLKKVSQVKDYDVVITTFQTLNGDFAIPKDVDPSEETEWLLKHGGVLANVKFFRAIADEAQFIRNRATRSSISMAHVRAKYRWMLTGTPVTNTLADIYGLLRFGRHRPWNDWGDFNTYVAKMQYEDAPEAGKRAQAILAPIILRRTKNSTIEGQPILQLPPKEVEIVTLEFSEEEREVYDNFEKQTTIQINRFIRANTLVKNHTFVLVLILRLRQLCCHPNLILSKTDELDDPTLFMSSEGEKELSRAIKAKGRPWVEKVQARFIKRALADEDPDILDDDDDVPDDVCPNCKDVYEDGSGRVLGCGHEICADCVQDLSNAPVAHDGEFGNGTEQENLAVEKQYEEAEAKGTRPCPTCRKMQDFSENKIFKSIAFAPNAEDLKRVVRRQREARRISRKSRSKDASDDDQDDDNLDMDEDEVKPKTFEERALPSDSDDDMPDISEIFDQPPKKRFKSESQSERDSDVLDLTMDDISAPLEDRKPSLASLRFKKDKTAESSFSSFKSSRKGSGKRSFGGQEKNSNGLSDAIIATWRRGDDDLEPSTKMLKLMEFLEEAEMKGDKTICYSQWTSMLDLIEILFSRHGIRTLRFDGKMNKNARDTTLTAFKKPDGPKVILISTKCGGVGLNLVSANRIVNMDLSWNYASESQAYDRAHRIGQEKPVFVKRLVVENTIEERMLRLQDVKVGLADAALGEGSGTKLQKLSVKDIKFLFGMTPPKPDANQVRIDMMNAAAGGSDDSD
ncbi:SNF2 family DNA-dependent ATPase [Mycena floridula]|nr:SNF2 family DNA-dependent ATPase [Mycena floridula]